MNLRDSLNDCNDIIKNNVALPNVLIDLVLQYFNQFVHIIKNKEYFKYNFINAKIKMIWNDNVYQVTNFVNGNGFRVTKINLNSRYKMSNVIYYSSTETCSYLIHDNNNIYAVTEKNIHSILDHRKFEHKQPACLIMAVIKNRILTGHHNFEELYSLTY